MPRFYPGHGGLACTHRVHFVDTLRTVAAACEISVSARFAFMLWQYPNANSVANSPTVGKNAKGSLLCLKMIPISDGSIFETRVGNAAYFAAINFPVLGEIILFASALFTSGDNAQ
jgi:hypothetical protein